MAGAQARTRSRKHGGTLLAGSVIDLCIAGFLIQPKITCPRNGATHYGLGSPIPISNQDRHDYRPVCSKQFLN